jgi:hypothetical protein
MTELDTTADVETEDFSDELSDETLDREEGSFFACNNLSLIGC